MKAYLSFFMGFAFSFTGCKKFVEVAPPITNLVSTSVFENASSATAALTSIYSQMTSESFSMAQSCGLLGDELENRFSSAPLLMQYYTNSMIAVNTVGPWISAYKYIYQANVILESLQKSTSINYNIQQQILSEARFIRAFWTFYLVNCYGDIPLVTTTDYSFNSKLGRTPVDQVYQQIIEDLKISRNQLSLYYVDVSDTTETIDRIRPTKWAASAMLARVYLYVKDYKNAENEATNVINNNSLYEIVGNLNDVFLRNSRESIWQLSAPEPSTYNTFDGQSFILNAPPVSGSGATNTNTISHQLLSSFENGDQRRLFWIDSIVTDTPVDTLYYPYKYKVYQSTDITENTMILRLAELYLIRAEARAQQNIDLNGAVADLNVIRKRAGLLEYGGTLDKDSLLIAILHERQVELFTEWGHRWFDLIRTDNVDKVMSVVTPLKGGDWNNDWRLFPIPQSERARDINLSQNNGY